MGNRWRTQMASHLRDTEKAIDKIQHPFVRGKVNKLGIQGNLLYLMKCILSGEGLSAFPKD